MSEKRTIKARIADDFYQKLQDFHGLPLDTPESAGERYYKIFCDTVQGKVVELVFTGDDAFEKVDNNIWIPSTCWTEVAVDHEIEACGSLAERDLYCDYLKYVRTEELQESPL